MNKEEREHYAALKESLDEDNQKYPVLAVPFPELTGQVNMVGRCEMVGIVDHSFAPRDRYPYPVSRDWALEGLIKCDCTECHANSGRGTCACPAIIKMDKEGRCTYRIAMKAAEKKKKRAENVKRAKRKK